MGSERKAASLGAQGSEWPRVGQHQCEGREGYLSGWIVLKRGSWVYSQENLGLHLASTSSWLL